MGQISELVINGETGLLVPPNDVDALVAALDSLVADPSLRSRLGRAAAEKVRLEFDARTQAGKYAAMYRRLLDRGPPPDGQGPSRLPPAHRRWAYYRTARWLAGQPGEQGAWRELMAIGIRAAPVPTSLGLAAGTVGSRVRALNRRLVAGTKGRVQG